MKKSPHKDKKKKKHIHNFDIEQCEFCGHTSEFCLECEKGHCSEEKKLTNPYV